MKKKIAPLYCFSKTHILILALLLNGYSSFTMSRTLIFQSESETSTAAQTVKAQNSVKNQPIDVNNTSPAQNTSSSANTELFFMIEQLKQEVNSLRGLLEEQSYELRMLKQSGKDRYQDLDTRILDITKRLSASNKNDSSPLSNKPVTPLEPKPVKLEVVEPIKHREPTAAENEDYQKAYALIKDKKFDESIIALFSYTEKYPDSPLLPNVYYWLGEVYLATSKLDQAKTSFSLVISAYPDSQKAADSLYKLAVTLDRLGDSNMAKQYLDDVKLTYPESTAAKLAASYKVIE